MSASLATALWLLISGDVGESKNKPDYEDTEHNKELCEMMEADNAEGFFNALDKMLSNDNPNRDIKVRT